MHKWQALRGVGVALVTPFNKQKIDFVALEKIINHVIAGGVDFVVSLGTTGEATTLSLSEKKAVLDFTIGTVAGRVPIVAGFGGNDTYALREEIQNYDFTGITAILSSSPAYNKPSQEGILRHYKALAEVCPVPIIIYNVPSRTASNIKPLTTLTLAKESTKFIGIKDANPNMTQIGKLIKHRPDDFLILSGDDPTAFHLTSCGGDGVISVLANALPDQFARMIHASLNQNQAEAASIHLELLDIHKWLYIDGNPAGIKAALEIMGLCSREVRLPLVAMESKNYEKLRQLLAPFQKSKKEPSL